MYAALNGNGLAGPGAGYRGTTILERNGTLQPPSMAWHGWVEGDMACCLQSIRDGRL
jgi:hypothetical protein